MTKTLFVSDIHLSNIKAPATKTFFHWLNTTARGSDAVYILGDLFEIWVGDDVPSALTTEVIQHLRALHDSGTPIFYIHGNRDFLIGEAFAKAAGITLLPEHVVIDIYGTPTLIMHGDTLCTQDTEYQAFRKKTRAPEFAQWGLAKPIWQRNLIAKYLRLRSHLRTRYLSKKNQTYMIMDVDPATVTRMMETYHVQHLIHGHTHRPAVHELTVNELPATRTVLGSWEKKASMLVCTPQYQQLIFFAITAKPTNQSVNKN
jgi:UDP-2,3-diacylglucosamine hydrolase